MRCRQRNRESKLQLRSLPAKEQRHLQERKQGASAFRLYQRLQSSWAGLGQCTRHAVALPVSLQETSPRPLPYDLHDRSMRLTARVYLPPTHSPP